MHAVLVRDWETVGAIRGWHEKSQPGALVLLPAEPGPPPDALPSGAHPLENRLRAEGPAAPWVRALLAGSEVLHPSGRVLRRATGAVFLTGAGSPSGPLRRRAELKALGHDIAQQEANLGAALDRLERRHPNDPNTLPMNVLVMARRPADA